jgi:hypothetical protein
MVHKVEKTRNFLILFLGLGFDFRPRRLQQLVLRRGGRRWRVEFVVVVVVVELAGHLPVDDLGPML